MNWRRFVSIAIVIVAAFWNRAKALHDPPGEVIDLSDLNLDEFKERLQDHEILLVKFYAPWCGHCKKLAPEWVKAAKELAKIKDGPVYLAEVDCWESGKGREICSTLDISSFPTIKFYRHGDLVRDLVLDPNDLRGSIVRFMRSQSYVLSASTHFETVESLIKHLKSSDRTNVFGLFNNRREPMYRTFLKTAQKLRWRAKFAHVFVKSDVDLEKLADSMVELQGRTALDDDIPMIVLYRPPKYHSYPEDPHEIYGGPEDDAGAMRRWVQDNFYGPIGHRQYQNEEDFKKPVFVIYYNVDFEANKEETLYWKHMVHPIARKWMNRYTFGVSNWNKYKHELNQVQLEPPAENATGLMPIVIAWDLHEMRYFMERPFHPEYFEEFVANYSAGLLWPKLKSQRPPDNEGEMVKEVVGSTFYDLVIDTPKDVFIMFYDPTCPFCQHVLPIWDQLAQLTSEDTDHLEIVKMDATKNELPYPYEATIYPTIYWVPAKDKRNPRKYDGGKTLDAFITFLSHYGQRRLKRFSRDGEDPTEFKIGHKVKYEL